jgi:RNA polymerase sigma-70 factor (ECF subfamily)
MLLSAVTPALAGDTPRERLARLFEAQHQRLFRLALRLAHDAEEARDLVQEAFLRVARRPQAALESDRDGEALLVRVLVNLCRDRHRRQVVRERGGAPASAPPSDAESQTVARDAVRRALATLPARRRAVVVMAELEERSTEEIAALLGISRVTVRWHLAAARKALRRYFGEEKR